MAKYKILTDGKVFYVKEKLLFIWTFVKEGNDDEGHYPKKFSSLEEATEEVKRLISIANNPRVKKQLTVVKKF